VRAPYGHEAEIDLEPGGDPGAPGALFATEPDQEVEVRMRIDAALARGAQLGPDGRTTRWRFVSAGPRRPRPEEAEHAARLVTGAG
jgi:hypothetical protein